jgi:hypothetical protein
VHTPANDQRRSPAEWRAPGALIALVTTVGTSLAFLFVAWIFATYNCEDGCPPGSRWAPGAWGSTVELWLLAVPACLAACALVWAIGAGRPKASLLAWTVNTVLLIAWCVFTGVSAVAIDFSGTNSHWMWLAGLITASGGGLVGVTVSLIGPRRIGGASPRRSTLHS